MKKVVSMGEIMLRLSAPGYERLVQSKYFNGIYGGGEANVAISLSNFGLDSYFVSKLPSNEIGHCALNTLSEFGVNTNYMAIGGERLGVYYLEAGTSMRAPKVIYDRTDSSFSKALTSDFDFDKIFRNASWFHLSGITPALSDDSAVLTEKALKYAKKHGVLVSLDMNYRSQLWSLDEASKCINRLIKYVDVFIGNEEDATNILGLSSRNTKGKSEKHPLDDFKDICEQMMDKYDFKYIVSTLRDRHSASDNGWSAMIYDGNEFYTSKKYELRIVDRVGGGDSFAAGLIFGLVSGMNSSDSLEFAVAASALKHTIKGDYNLVTSDEVLSLVNGDTSGRVQR